MGMRNLLGACAMDKYVVPGKGELKRSESCRLLLLLVYAASPSSNSSDD